jgi:hypothetical protein
MVARAREPRARLASIGTNGRNSDIGVRFRRRAIRAYADHRYSADHSSQSLRHLRNRILGVEQHLIEQRAVSREYIPVCNSASATSSPNPPVVRKTFNFSAGRRPPTNCSAKVAYASTTGLAARTVAPDGRQTPSKRRALPPAMAAMVAASKVSTDATWPIGSNSAMSKG